jgi:hypothetical protein
MTEEGAEAIRCDQPAFPVNDYRYVKDGVLHTADSVGMSLRDYFAAAAMQGIMASGSGAMVRDHAALAYALADAMLAERAK